MSNYSNISDWTKNMASFPQFENTYSDGTNNTLIYKGGAGYERIYYSIPAASGVPIVFKVKFYSPTGYNCMYGDSQEYIAITKNQPDNTNPLSQQTILGRTALSSTAGETEYTVTVTPNYDGVAYAVIDLGYMEDGVTIELVYKDIQINTEYTWYLSENGNLLNEKFIENSPSAMVEPYPPSAWRIKAGIEDGYPYNTLMPIEPSPIIVPVEQYDYITVYDVQTPQNGFDNNGLAILCPTRCMVTEELNGGWNLIIEHPIDNEGKWEYIKENNYIKALGQIFTIKRVDTSFSGNSGRVSAYAEHVFYHLNDWWLPEGTSIYPYSKPTAQITAADYIAMAFHYVDYAGGGSQIIFDYSYASDIKYSYGIDDYDHYDLKDDYLFDPDYVTEGGQTLMSIIIGNEGILTHSEAELYRDNFYFSLKKRMENALDDAFELSPDLNIKTIKRTVDVSQMVTHGTYYNEWAGSISFSWNPDQLKSQFPHNVVRREKLEIPDEVDDTYLYDYFVRTARRKYSQDCKPRILYELNIKDLKRIENYKDIYHFRFKVGDKGRIHDDRLIYQDQTVGYVAIQVTKNVTNAITGEVESVTFGQTMGFGRKNDYPYDPTPEPIVVNNMEFWLSDSTGKKIIDSHNKKIMRKVDLSE